MSELYGSLIILAFSFAFLILGIKAGIFMLQANKTKGIIVDIEREVQGGDAIIKTTIEYKTTNGRIYQYMIPFHPSFKGIGDQVIVYYDAKKPNEDVEVTAYAAISNLTIGLMLLGFSLYYLIKYINH